MVVRKWPKVQVFGVLLVGDSRSLAECEQGQSRWQSQQVIELHADLSKLGHTAHETCDLVGSRVVSEVRSSLSHACLEAGGGRDCFTPDYIMLGGELLPKVACGLHAPNSKHRHPTPHFCAQPPHFTLVLDTLELFADTTTRESTVREHQHREQQQRTTEKQQPSKHDNREQQQQPAADRARILAFSRT
jgi:hypothetical protein